MSRAQPDLFGAPPTKVDSFEKDAMGFLLAYAKKHRGKSFSSEEVTLAAMKKGIASTDLRHWGAVFAQAAKDGAIRRSEVLFKRSMGNGTLSPGWTAV